MPNTDAHDEYCPGLESAMCRTLAISELLEHILLSVDHNQTLLLAQRVSKHWHKLIASSPSLQVELFFRPHRTKGYLRVNHLLLPRPSKQFDLSGTYVLDPFTLPPHSSALRMYATSNSNPRHFVRHQNTHELKCETFKRCNCGKEQFAWFEDEAVGVYLDRVLGVSAYHHQACPLSNLKLRSKRSNH
ncbi:hypothetical protein B0A48_16662 [Cryoendolithus antarcticus]|uniref:Uncharacterized protein n=1 Tax=Cryoendolithus antarcticus TaxID=1507870 RepID=A0A1V8SEK6_9PEZI|nr:hypothetical protein B0A48_16662 [Cryoendolithus antarcticus]